ncbi:HD-GYP domain-containing protein [Pseudomonas sp. TNT2022 ID1044]|uniref:HD-GYP domain-containing protein n=1 Tax=Pseudomonas sp. TNT2022 ID1044 TaxID=2942636 RepID=UPI002362B68F|nr:HD-GYP domain-containing protein [Pseudomonas sp. TNT2022 ID1044]MDD1000044.1 HD-GYP domain-containing protein [Pseudomonas sp. TNT2022 ID1044]
MKLMQRLNHWLNPAITLTDLSVQTPLLASLLTMSWLVEARDPYTGGHLWRVSQYCALLAKEMGFAPNEVVRIALGGFVHDLGKVGIPDAVLRKAGPLSDDEYSVIKTHPEIGKRMLEGHPFAALVMDAVWSHHEMPNGRGYPRGLTSEQIPTIAAITGICDAFDAMTSNRPYREGMPLAKALGIIESGAGSQFDSHLASSFVKLGRQGLFDHVMGHTDDGIPLRHCLTCGPTVVVRRTSIPGDQVFCPVCGSGYELHPAESRAALILFPTGKKGSAAQLSPSPDTELIARLASRFAKSPLT